MEKTSSRRVPAQILENCLSIVSHPANDNFTLIVATFAKLKVEILGSKLGKGVGDCKYCKDIQEITAAFSFESK
jgi:hypothetical protein